MEYIANKLNAKISFTDFSTYKHGDDRIDILPVEHFKHRINKDGEPTQKKDRLPRNSSLKILVENNKIVKSIYLNFNPIYMKYIRYNKWNLKIKFGKRRGIMGCIIIKNIYEL